jgi:type II secretory pathway pseudopilin PulG
MGTILAIVAFVILVLIGIAMLAFFRSIADERARAAERRAQQLENLLDEVKDIAWTNRELAPDLATIIIDTIRTNEEVARRRQLP